MSGIHTNLVAHAHDYTRTDAPWELGEYHSTYGRLIHYISGGGMSTFGRTVGQEIVRRKHRRFLIVSAAIGSLWLFFYFI